MTGRDPTLALRGATSFVVLASEMFDGVSAGAGDGAGVGVGAGDGAGDGAGMGVSTRVTTCVAETDPVNEVGALGTKVAV